MKKFTLAGAAALALAVPAVALFAAPTSGLNPGERVSPFHPKHVSGPLANSENCFPCTFKDRPQVQIWVNGDSTENVLAFAKTLQKATEANKGKEFKGMVVFITENPAATEATIKAAVAKTKAKDVAMAYLSPSSEAISDYKINTGKDVKNTVFAYREWKVADKVVNLSADEKGLARLNDAIAKVAR